MMRGCVKCGKQKSAHQGEDLLCKPGSLTCYATMDLPQGETCADCHYVRHCVGLYGVKRENTHCDFFPVRFIKVTPKRVAVAAELVPPPPELLSAATAAAAYCMGMVTVMAARDGRSVDRSLLEDCHQVDLALGHSQTLRSVVEFADALYKSWKEKP